MAQEYFFSFTEKNQKEITVTIQEGEDRRAEWNKIGPETEKYWGWGQGVGRIQCGKENDSDIWLPTPPATSSQTPQIEEGDI